LHITATSPDEANPLIQETLETPHRQSALDLHGLMLGTPGSTPKPRVSDLKRFGFDDFDEELILGNTTSLSSRNESKSNIMQSSDTHENHSTGNASPSRSRKKKSVRIGEEGSTPKKEYIFYRETPPSFVTESVDAAREVMEKLKVDPAYDAVVEEPQRFVELSSSDVGKYEIGKVS
jgi:hypothetical protein